MILTKLHYECPRCVKPNRSFYASVTDQADVFVAALRLSVKSSKFFETLLKKTELVVPIIFASSFFNLQALPCNLKGNNAMFFRSMSERRSNWDYRDYCDHRTRLKRRQRLRLSIMAGLMVCLLLVAGVGAVKAGI